MIPIQDLNSVNLIGRLVKDPELRTTPGGLEVASMRVAYTQNKKTAGGAWEESAGFIDVTVFGKQAETACRFLSKGRQIAVNGRLEFREWGEGAERQSRTQIIANQVQFIGANDDRQQSAPRPAAQAPAPAQPGYDDIPF